MNEMYQDRFAKGKVELSYSSRMMNRHGIIAGATGTGKTVTLKVLAESFSSHGVPVFLADIKGDLASVAIPGVGNPKLEERIKMLGLEGFQWKSYPTRVWDVFGEKGHPIRTTVSEMGPLLISRLLQLNETQIGVLNIVFKIADDEGYLLLDLKDLRVMLNYVGDRASEYTTQYGTISKVTIGAIQRGLLTLESEGAEAFFGEPALDILDFFTTDAEGRGVINVLTSERLFHSPRVYSTFLLWLLSELFEELPEVGDLDKPKLVFFFDEAHLLFNDAPKALVEKIEQVVRLIRSKGVGVFFVTQNPGDIPDRILSQLGNRIQHALRAYTPHEQKGLKTAAESFRVNPELDTQTALTELKTGEALVSMLDEDGRPSIVQRVFVFPPHSLLGTIDEGTRSRLIRESKFDGKYRDVRDRESAYELITKRIEREEKEEAREKERLEKEKQERKTTTTRKTTTSRRTSSRRTTGLEKAANSMMTQIGRTVGRELIRGVLGSLKKF